MSRVTIIDPADVLVYTPVDKAFPLCDFRQLYAMERRIAEDCLGKTLYKAMIAALADYSATTAYDNTTAYADGATATYKGAIYQVITGQGPVTGVLPSNKTKWELAPRFDPEAEHGECYENLWCLYLGELLSWNAVRRTVPFAAYKMSGEGIVKIETENSKPVSKNELNSLIAFIDGNIEQLYSDMHKWICNEINCEGSECWSCYKADCTTCESCNDCTGDLDDSEYGEPFGNCSYESHGDLGCGCEACKNLMLSGDSNFG